MAKGTQVSPGEFVAFSGPRKSLTAQTVSRSCAIDFYGLGMYLPSLDPTLKAQGRDIRIYRELHTGPPVGGCIHRRKAALKSLERGLECSRASARVFRLIRDMLDDLDLPRVIGEASDVVLHGYQPYEIMWGHSVRAWAMTDIIDKPLEWFQSDTDDCLHFQARDAGVEGELLSPSKSVVSAQDTSYNSPYGFPDLFMCFQPAAFKKGGMKFWFRFAEKFGSLWMIGKHSRGTNDAEIEKLLDSMEQMVENAVIAIPDDNSIELKTTDGETGSSEVFRKLIILSCSKISIALLGQSQAAEADSNKASAQAGLEVTADTHNADADIIQAVMNQVIRTVVILNFGNVPYPIWAMWEQETIDGIRAAHDEELTRAGLRLTPQCFKREYQLRNGDIDETSPSGRQNNMLSLSFAGAIDADIQTQQQLDDALDTLMNGGVSNDMLEPILAPLFKRARNGVNPTELLGKLVEPYPQMNTDNLQERLARILFVADIWGRLHERDSG